jgi:hypothetical protein
MTLLKAGCYSLNNRINMIRAINLKLDLPYASIPTKSQTVERGIKWDEDCIILIKSSLRRQGANHAKDLSPHRDFLPNRINPTVPKKVLRNRIPQYSYRLCGCVVSITEPEAPV